VSDLRAFYSRHLVYILNQVRPRNLACPKLLQTTKMMRTKKKRLSATHFLSDLLVSRNHQRRKVDSCIYSTISCCSFYVVGKPRSRASSDDDDFIVPDDSDGETHSVKSAKSSSSRRSSTSSRRSGLISDEDSEEAELDQDDLDLDDEPRKRGKNMAKASSSKSSKSKKSSKGAAVPVGDGGNGSFTLLTAAEQREQGKKDDKKAAESPYSFLLNVKDVGVIT
jgi:hypothetical protein